MTKRMIAVFVVPPDMEALVASEAERLGKTVEEFGLECMYRYFNVQNPSNKFLIDGRRATVQDLTRDLEWLAEQPGADEVWQFLKNTPLNVKKWALPRYITEAKLLTGFMRRHNKAAGTERMAVCLHTMRQELNGKEVTAQTLQSAAEKAIEQFSNDQ